jgi:hypothetical protein
MAGSILFVPFAHIEDVVHLIVMGMDRWGLVPRSLLFWWAEASFSCAADGAGWSGSRPCHRDVELLTCCTVAHSRRARSSPWACHPSRVDGLGIV